MPSLSHGLALNPRHHRTETQGDIQRDDQKPHKRLRPSLHQPQQRHSKGRLRPRKRRQGGRCPGVKNKDPLGRVGDDDIVSVVPHAKFFDEDGSKDAYDDAHYPGSDEQPVVPPKPPFEAYFGVDAQGEEGGREAC